MKARQNLFSVSLLGVAVLLSLRCATGPGGKTPESKSLPSTSRLSKVEAELRAAQITNLDYEIEIDLSHPGDRYHGKETIRFDLMVGGKDLRLDFTGGQVTRLTLNGKPITLRQNAHFITLPAQELRKGPQRLELEFNQEYNREARGLTRFLDPVDNQGYVYTNFEPYDANRFIPCFDQPDLKATYSIKVTAPATWEVITSVRELRVENAASGAKIWTFPRSERFSTYILPLHAGPFAKWEDKSFRIPLRLFARKSLAKDVKPGEWFPITRHGFDFFEKFFDTKYPYKKYDQVIVPEFGAAAMENVAAVTFGEPFISRGEKSKAELGSLANVILHEMAHMWFGNLVTMRWWGDLWLNESFATYMATVAQAASPEFKQAWHQYYNRKTWAYVEDQLVTTHPVVAQIKDTAEAMTAFDGITYGKGSAVLKQLSYTIGENSFKKGLKIYFDRYAEKNTEYRDFIAALGEASGRDLEKWQRDWFETSGLNTISAQFECRAGRISQFAILQSTASGDNLVRPHAFEVALLSRSNGVVAVQDQFRVEIAQPTTYIPAAIGKPCPHVVYPNVNDHGYFKARLDERSLSGLKISLNEVQDALLRHQLWDGVWDKVRDAEFSFVAFGDLLLPESFAKEKDEVVLRRLSRLAQTTLGYYLMSPSLKNEMRTFGERLDQQLLLRLKTAKGGSNDQLVWFDGLTQLSTSPLAISQVKRLLSGQSSYPGLRLDQDKRWDLVRVLSRNNDPDALKLIETEAKRDPSSKGLERRIASLASRPDWDEKLKWVQEYKQTKSTYSLSQLRAALRHLFPINQEELREKFSAQFYPDLLVVNQSKSDFALATFTYLVPNECDATRAGRTLKFLSNNKNLQPIVMKSLRVSAQEGERCRKVVDFAEKGPSL